MTPASQALRRTSPELESERRRALRALLRNPLLSATGETAEGYGLVRRHSEWLKQWLSKFPNWGLHVDGSVARLRKIPADLLDPTRTAVDQPSGTPFTRRKYALLCLVLAALEQLDRQTTLGEIAETVMELVAADRDLQAAGLAFDSGNYDQRRDLVHAVRFLVDAGVLRKRDGEELRFQRSTDSADALYDIDRHILAAILQVSQSASAIEASRQQSRRSGGDSVTERAARLVDQPIPATEDGRGQWIRSRLVRALLDDPVLYLHELSDEEQKYLEKHRGSILREICVATGLVAEVRREGIAMVDPAGDLTDLQLMDHSPDQLSLLLVQWFAESAKNSAGTVIPISAVEAHVRGMVQRDAGSETGQTEDALLRLRALRLIQSTDGGVVPLAASCRYAAVAGNEE